MPFKKTLPLLAFFAAEAAGSQQRLADKAFRSAPKAVKEAAAASFAAAFYSPPLAAADKGAGSLAAEAPKTAVFVRDSKGRLGALTALSPAGRFFAYNNKLAGAVFVHGDRVFQSSSILAISLDAGLAFWGLEGMNEAPELSSAGFFRQGLSQSAGSLKPLTLRKRALSGKEAFYAAGFLSKNKREFSVQRAGGAKFAPELGALSFVLESHLFSPSSSGALLDQEGRLVSLLDVAEHNHGLAAAPEALRELLGGRGSLSCRGLSAESCILKAKKLLYKKAKAGDRKAQHRIMSLLPLPLPMGFENFMKAIGERRQAVIQSDMEAFFKGMLASQMNYSVYKYFMGAEASGMPVNWLAKNPPPEESRQGPEIRGQRPGSNIIPFERRRISRSESGSAAAGGPDRSLPPGYFGAAGLAADAQNVFSFQAPFGQPASAAASLSALKGAGYEPPGGGGGYLREPLKSLVHEREFIDRIFRLANRGHAPAAHFLGSSMRGRHSAEPALYWLRKAANQGYFPAYKALIDMYNKNEGEIRKKIAASMAANWRRAASRFGYSNCKSLFKEPKK